MAISFIIWWSGTEKAKKSMSMTNILGSRSLDKHCREELARDYNWKEHCAAFKHTPSFNKLNLTLAVTSKICILFAYACMHTIYPVHAVLQYWLGVLALLLNMWKCYFLCSYSPYYAFLCSVSVWAWRKELSRLFSGRLQ